MRSSLKAPQLARGLATELVMRAVRGEKPAIRRLQAALGRAGKPISPEPLVVTILNFSDDVGPADGPFGAGPYATALPRPRRGECGGSALFDVAGIHAAQVDNCNDRQ